MLLAYQLVRLVERHADELANSLLQQVRKSPRTAEFSQRVPADDLKLRATVARNSRDGAVSELQMTICFGSQELPGSALCRGA